MWLRIVAVERSDSTRPFLSRSSNALSADWPSRARQRTGEIARLLAQPVGIGNERVQKPHQRPPLLDGAAEIVHGVLVRALGIEDRRAGAVENIAGNCAHRRADGGARPQGGFVAHFSF